MQFAARGCQTRRPRRRQRRRWEHLHREHRRRPRPRRQQLQQRPHRCERRQGRRRRKERPGTRGHREERRWHPMQMRPQARRRRRSRALERWRMLRRAASPTAAQLESCCPVPRLGGAPRPWWTCRRQLRRPSGRRPRAQSSSRGISWTRARSWRRIPSMSWMQRWRSRLPAGRRRHRRRRTRLRSRRRGTQQWRYPRARAARLRRCRPAGQASGSRRMPPRTWFTRGPPTRGGAASRWARSAASRSAGLGMRRGWPYVTPRGGMRRE